MNSAELAVEIRSGEKNVPMCCQWSLLLHIFTYLKTLVQVANSANATALHSYWYFIF